MGSRLRQLRLLKVTVVLAAIAGTAVLVSTALASSFPGENGKLAFYVNDGNGTPGYIATANAVAGSKQMRISSPDPSTDQGDFLPRFSADGTEVVFTRNAAKVGYNHLQIWIADANLPAGATVKAVEHQVKLKGMPAGTFPDLPTFTPDGKNIIFMLDTINSPVGLGEVSVGGGQVTQLPTGAAWQPSVSPDGSKIAFINGSGDLVVTDIHGNNPQTLYTEPQSASTMDLPDWSPDGSTIAFEEADQSSGVSDIWTIAADGSDNGVATNLTNGTTTSSFDPAYSPDGTEIAFTSVDNSTYATAIDVMGADGGAPTTVVKPPKNGFIGKPDWGVATTPPPPHKHHHRHHHHRHHHKRK